MTEVIDEPIEAEKLTLSEALEMLTMGEIGLIEQFYTRLHGQPKHFGGEGDRELAPMETLTGAIWAMEKRTLGKAYGWENARALTLKAANAYFLPEPIEADEEDPDSDEGKGDSPGAVEPESEPSSAPY